MEPACRRRPGSLCGLARGARRICSRAVALAPRGCIARNTPFADAACSIGPKCQNNDGVLILIFSETVAALPGAMGSTHIAEAMRWVTRRAGGKPTVIARGPEPWSPGLLGPNHGLAPGLLATVSENTG